MGRYEHVCIPTRTRNKNWVFQNEKNSTLGTAIVFVKKQTIPKYTYLDPHPPNFMFSLIAISNSHFARE